MNSPKPPGKQKPRVIKDIVRYASSQVFFRFCGALNIYIKPRLLSPELYGLWNLFSIIWTYASYTQLGSREAMHYLIPQNEAMGLEEKNQEIAQSTFWITFVFSSVLAFGVMAYALIRPNVPTVRIGLAALAVMIMLNWYRDFYFSYLRSHQRFSVMGAANYLRAVVALALNVALIYAFGIYGLYAAATLTVAITLGFLRKYAPFRFQRKASLKVFKGLIGIGFPILFYNALNRVIVTTDQIVISWLLGTEPLGYYAIAGLVVGTIAQIPSGSREVLEPLLMQQLGIEQEETTLHDFFYKPILMTAYLIPLLIGGVYFAFPILISLILPRYQDSVLPTQILTIGSFFITLSFTTRGMIVAKGKQMAASLAITGIIPLSFLLNYCLIKAGFGLPGVAFGSGICYVVLYLTLISVVMKLYMVKVLNVLGLTGAILLPFSIMCGIIYTLDTISPGPTGYPIIDAAINITILCGIHGLLFLLARRTLWSFFIKVR